MTWRRQEAWPLNKSPEVSKNEIRPSKSTWARGSHLHICSLGVVFLFFFWVTGFHVHTLSPFLEMLSLSQVLSKLSLLAAVTSASSCGMHYQHDVVVYGGTSGGYAAAIQLSRLNHSVALIEPSSHVGGIAVDGFGASDIDSQVGPPPLLRHLSSTDLASV